MSDSLKYIKTFSAILLLFLLAVSVGNSKPLPPLSITMQWQDAQSADVREMPVVLTLSIFSQISVDEVEIVLTLPDGVVLFAGQAKETTSIDALKPLEKTYTVQISQTAVGDIMAEVQLSGSGHIAYYAVATLPVVESYNSSTMARQKLSPSGESAEQKKQEYKRTQHDGVWLREYHLP